MHRLGFAFHLIWLTGCAAWAQPVSETVPLPDPVVHEALPADELLVAVDVPPGSSFGEIAQRWQLPAYALREAALSVHDLALIRPNQELGLVFVDGQEAPASLRFELDEDRTLMLHRDGESWRVEVEATAYDSHEVALTLEISSSLWEAGMAAGLRPSDLYELARIFEYELDFNTEIRAGARLGLVGEMLSSEGRRDKLGTVHAVRLVNDGKAIDMIRFIVDDEVSYYHPDGTATKRPFLRSPLEFSRVTSGFNPRRFHPILKTSRPHNGTDFGAPTGTPVRTVADGVVTVAGRSGGHGNYVQIKHDDQFETSYSHLSSIGVKKGQRVQQGAVIGRVGATGLATGPHLHFQMWKQGRYVDPMRIDLPVTRPLEARHLPAFQQTVAIWAPKLPVERPTP